MLNTFQEILDCRSGTLIGYLADDAIPLATGAHKEALIRIQNERSLDEIWAIAAEALGDTVKAAELRANRALLLAKRRPSSAELETALGLS
jgi:hypothetical protein